MRSMLYVRIVDVSRLRKDACLFDLRRQTVAKLEQHLKTGHDQANGEEVRNIVRDYSLRRLLGVQRWDLEDPLAASRVGTLARFSQILADFEHVRRRSRW